MTDPVRTKITDRVTEIILSRAEVGNALDMDSVSGIIQALDALPAEGCDIVVFRGEGKGFCGGLDLSSMEAETDASLLWRLVQIELMLQRVAALPQETVAFAHRFAFGAGADLFIACRRRIVAAGTKFSFPGVRFGIALGTGRLARCVGPDRARSLLAATTPISCETALSSGLVTETAEIEAWADMIRDIAAQPSSLDARMAGIVADCMAAGQDDVDLAALVRSAGVAGLKTRIADYAASVRPRDTIEEHS